jgi:O-antigen ligase
MRSRAILSARGKLVMATTGAAALLVLLAVMAAVSPTAGVACAPLLALGAVAAAHRAVTMRISVAVAAALALVALVLLAAVRPETAVLVALVTATAGVAGAAAWKRRELLSRAFRVVRGPLIGAAAVILLVGLAFLASLWPTTTLLGVLVLAVLVLGWHRPGLGLAAAVLLFGFEGSVKILLGLEVTPIPGGNRAVGAAALDLALFGAVAAVLVKDRFRAPRAVWASASRSERVAIGLLLAWLALSVLQVAQGGDLNRGIHGFRLFQAYTLVAVATLTVFARPWLRTAAARAALAIGLVVSLYAAVRVLFGPTHAEHAFAISVPTVTSYGEAVRAIGSFSSAIGLSSFLTPLAVFALVLGLLRPRLRLLAWTVAALALVGLVGSYSRASLFGVVFGLVCGLLVVFVTGDMPGRRKLVAAGLVLALLAGTYGAVLIASKASPQLEARAKGMLNPFADESVQLRFDTWKRTLDEVGRHPFGEGVGAVGAASARSRATVKTTDNSFLKVLVEQGVIGFALFIGGALAGVILLARRLRGAAAEPRAIGLAALAGFVTFLGVSATGETVEQPGKVVAWGLLGMAAGVASTPAGRGHER